MRQLALELNADGYRTTRGSPYTGVSLGRILDNGFAAGLIRERSEIRDAESTGKRISQYDIWREGAHEAIVSAELWEANREKRLANEQTAPRLRTAVHSLSGLVFCAQCLNRMSATKGGSTGAAAECRRAARARGRASATTAFRTPSVLGSWRTHRAERTSKPTRGACSPRSRRRRT
ncbi:hypothetical protein HII36_01960 [Nonomuraea sp. NN258]|nr:hypothetical protein [Nonomuraea antri]